MPRLVGLVSRLPREHAEQRTLKMLSVIRLGVGDIVGVWAEPSMGLYVGWVAQEGPSDNTPLRNKRGDVVLFFSGQEFPAPQTKQRLKSHGHEFEESGPSYLVHLYEEENHSFLGGLNGRFHGLLIDGSRRTAFLFNDRYAMHRLYYHQAKDGFYFAAEAKAILAVCPETRRLDLQGAGEFVSCNCTLDGRTLFDGIRVLPGGARWALDKGPIAEKHSYFAPSEWENLDPLEPQSYYRELRDVFSANLPRYFQGPEEVAMSLTGGLDTRMIMAWQNRAPGTLPCYTFGNIFRDCQDVILSQRIANVCGQSHRVLPVGDEFFKEFGSYAERTISLTDGGVDVGRAPDLYLNEKAREIAPVRMSGVYGGEVLRGVVAFKPEETRSELFAPEFRRYIRQATDTYNRLRHGHQVSFAVFKQAPWAQYGILGLEQSQLSVRTPFLDNDLVRTVFRAPEAARASAQTCIRLISDGNPSLLPIPTDRGLCLNRRPLRQAASHSALEFLFKAEYAYDIGMPQWLASVDHALSTFRFQRVFLGRHKVFHFRVWYRDLLAGYLRNTLLDSKSLSRSYIERRELESILHRHLRGDRNYTLEIHKVLTLELVQRLFFDAQHDHAYSESSAPVAACAD